MSSDSSKLSYYLKQAETAYQKRSFEAADRHLAKAEALLERELDRDPDNLQARRDLASILFATGNHDRSRALYVSVIDTSPLDADAHFA